MCAPANELLSNPGGMLGAAFVWYVVGEMLYCCVEGCTVVHVCPMGQLVVGLMGLPGHDVSSDCGLQ